MCVHVHVLVLSLKRKNKIKPSLGLWILSARWLYLYHIRLVWTSGKDPIRQQFSCSDSLLKSPLKQPGPGFLPPSLYLLAESKSNTVQGYTLGWEPGNLDGLRSASHCRYGLRNKLLNWHTCLWVSVAALLTRAKWQEQPKWLSVGGWMGKLWSMHTMEYYTAIKGRKHCKHDDKWEKPDTSHSLCHSSFYMTCSR